jgi:hypothetical protein
MGLCVVAVFATSAFAAASASAAPEFLHLAAPLSATGFTGKSVGAVELADNAMAAQIKCSKEELAGEIEPGGTTKVEEVRITFKGCGEVVAVGGKKVKCSVKSPARAAGVLVTRRLIGQLGEVLPAEAVDEAGLALEPEVGTVVMRIEAPGCGLPLAVVEGSIIGEVTPTSGPETITKQLVSAPLGPAQKIQKLTSGPIDTLEVAATKVTLKSTMTLKFEEILEVT